MSVGTEREAKLTTDIGRRTRLTLYTINSEGTSGIGTVVTSRIPGISALNHTHSFGFNAASDTEVTVGSGGVLRNHEVTVGAAKDGTITVKRTKPKDTKTIFVTNLSADAVRTEPRKNGEISKDLVPLLAIGAVAAGIKLFPNLRTRRALRYLIAKPK